MRPSPQLELLFGIDPASTLVELAHMGTNDSAIVSCYLDARGGMPGCLAFINRKAVTIRGALRGVDRFNFDGAVEMIRRSLTEELRDDTQGIAIFARGASEGRYLSVVQTAMPLDNRLVVSRVPEILPLIALAQREPACHLLIVHQGQFDLLETGLGASAGRLCNGALETAGGHLRTRAVAALPGRSDAPARPAEDVSWRLRRALVDRPRPLLLVGDAESLVGAADWLPDQATEGLVGCVEVPADADRRALLEAARVRLAAVYRSESQRLATGVARSGNTPLGYRAVLKALQRDDVEAVVIADWDHPGLGLPWEAEVELCLEALKRRTQVILGDCVQLREAGGVGCLLRAGVSGVSPVGANAQVGLDQVA